MRSSKTYRERHGLAYAYYRWFYEHIFSRFYDIGVRSFLLHFGGESRFRREMLGPVVFAQDDKVLDLCCGTGSLTFAIRREIGPAAEIIGVDLSHGQLATAKKKNEFSNVTFILGDGSATGLTSGYFHKVSIGHALHEMPGATRQAVLNEARRVMKDNGQLIVLEFDRAPALGRRLWLGLWLGSWIPYPLNFERRAINEMFKQGIIDQVRQAGFHHIRKFDKYKGTMQTIIALK